MKKLTVNDLPNLSESDKGIVFNYFGALGSIARRRKQAFALAIFGCFVIGLSYFIDSAAADINSEYAWIPNGLHCMPRSPGDEPQIVETWI